MVFLHFPSSLTEEEQMLQRKYAQLRKKKKQLAAIKNSTEEGSAEQVAYSDTGYSDTVLSHMVTVTLF